jgi:hypothetical protein
MGAAMPALFAIQAGMQAGEAYTSYTSERSAGRLEKTASDINAATLRRQAQDAIKRGDEGAGRVRRDASMIKGEQRAAYAGQGVDVGSGTAAAIQTETDVVGELDAQTIKNNAWREAWGLQGQADEVQRQGRMAQKASKNRAKNSLITGGLNVVSTAAQYGAWKGGMEPKYAKAGGRVVPVAPRSYTKGRY